MNKVLKNGDIFVAEDDMIHQTCEDVSLIPVENEKIEQLLAEKI